MPLFPHFLAFVFENVHFGNCNTSQVLYLDEDSEIYKSAIPMELIMEAGPRGRYGNAHTHHVSSMSVDSDHSFLTADDLRINLWHHEVTNESFNIVDIGYFVDIKILLVSRRIWRNQQSE
ncbi:hypothetical protein Y032_0012g1792 [Ancylostoma ceylanicum]|uniref:Serine/threonine-protein phosphatase 2A 55 kDa regulatory subunit B n=1 Tax=Ancylostoma ceylanicum TaxID=53326 RepID=A0A016VCV1_9BILA|nr:hypothetical protein Y032_0012g1792 [Ancylostoma ceylanicum]